MIQVGSDIKFNWYVSLVSFNLELFPYYFFTSYNNNIVKENSLSPPPFFFLNRKLIIPDVSDISPWLDSVMHSLPVCYMGDKSPQGISSGAIVCPCILSLVVLILITQWQCCPIHYTVTYKTHIHIHTQIFTHGCKYMHTYVYYKNPKFILICLIPDHPKEFVLPFPIHFCLSPLARSAHLLIY